MDMVTLGRTGITVNKNGFGALPIQRVSREEAARHAVQLAAEYGGADSIRYALWEGGEITLQGGWGVYSRSENRALTEDILYGVGSVSKTYTAAAVLKLCEEGALTLETPVAEDRKSVV